MGVVAGTTFATSAEKKVFIQENISSARIVASDAGFSVDVNILATDVEQMFQKSIPDLKGVDLYSAGALEREIGKFVSKRITIRGHDGTACPNKVEKSGEDPKNDEGVLVSLSVDCPHEGAIYDARELLAAAGSRAWQVVMIETGTAARQVMINSESAPVRIDAR